MKRIWMVLLAACSLVLMGVGPTDVIDPALPRYERVRGVAGSLKSIGSDTMNNVMAHWAESFKKFYPNVTIEIEGKGSSTAPPALIEGRGQFGPMSRTMKPSEVDEFEKAFGYKPTPLRTGIDALAVYVHKDCPLDEISIDQLVRVFSVESGSLSWGDLGVDLPGYRDAAVSLYSRNSASGTYSFFKSIALRGNDFKASVKEQPGSSAVVQAVANDRYAMGYSGIGYRTANVKVLSISEDGFPPADPTLDNCLTGDYPLARFLYVYINYDARKGLDPLRREFVRMIYSKEGQVSLLKDGYFPILAAVAREDLKRVGLTPGF